MDPRVIIGLGTAGAVAAAWWLDWLPSFSMYSLTGVAPSGTAGRDYIVAAFVAAGLPEALGRGAAVNSYKETAGTWDNTILSGYRNSAGVRENSVGWFQLNAAGLGESVALPLLGAPPNETVTPGDPRLDPQVQCDLVIAACRGSMTIMNMPADSSVRAFTAAFCIYVERPANATVEAAMRVALVDRIWPGVP